MLHCVKTGATAYLKIYGEILHGDMYQCNEVFIYRVSQRIITYKQDIPYKRGHFIIRDLAQWFDMCETSLKRPSTLIVPMNRLVNYGYDGVELEELINKKLFGE